VNKDDDDERARRGPTPQEWYTGGASSGQAVVDPRARDERLGAMFDGARAHGAVDGNARDFNPNASDDVDDHAKAFRGRARTLAGGDEGERARANEAASNANDIHSVVVTFWHNGFTIDDGALRTFDDPANVAFMESIARGEAPAELAPRDRSRRLNINLVQRHEDYVAPPAPKYTAFAGSGRTLSREPETSASASARAAAAAVAPRADDWNVDESQPTTSIQIRLRDGSRLVAKFNTSHTVGHIRSFIAKSRPSESFAYALQLNGFPPKTLDDDHAVIADVGLAGAVVIQR